MSALQSSSEKSVVHCQMAHFSADSPAVSCGAGTVVPARDPARGEHHVSGLWAAAGEAGDRRDPLGEHVVSEHRKMVAGALPGTGAGRRGGSFDRIGSGLKALLDPSSAQL